VLAVYTLTMFISAALLFLVQPMFAKMVLPLFGGSPAVWITAMLFFQLVLLVGYIYAHATSRWLGPRRQIALHVALLLLPLLALPVGIPAGWSPPTAGAPIVWLLALLAVAVGLPFFVVSTSSPLLQSWFARTGHQSAADPYFLYAASNVGSMLALVSYPLLAERFLPLGDQSTLWTAGYGLLLTLTVVCAAVAWHAAGRTNHTGSGAAVARDPSHEGAAAEPAIDLRRRLRWVLLAFIPSSLMLSVTTHITTTIAPIPMLWIIPLSIYLLTFILVFQTRFVIPHALLLRRLPLALVLVAAVLGLHVAEPTSFMVLLHLIPFFVAAMVCHGELASDRPSTSHLTEFYLWLSIGGALGGVFNALVAPAVFETVLEYPIVIVVLALLVKRSSVPSVPSARAWLDVALPLAAGVYLLVMVQGMRAAGIETKPLTWALIIMPVTWACLSFRNRPVRFALGVAVLMLGGALNLRGGLGIVTHDERSFFGISRVQIDTENEYSVLLHGDTVHGMQSRDPARSREPLMYYGKAGPIGQLFEALQDKSAERHVGVVGLGAGSLACYSRPGEAWTFYEIDPVVMRIAQNPRYFTYLQECAPHAAIVLGDARLSLAKVAVRSHDILIMDAYSSDSVPVHLITREALRLYLDKLHSHGVLAFHISNRYVNLEPVLAALAKDSGLAAFVQVDRTISQTDLEQGRVWSHWVVMARQEADLGGLADDSRWRQLEARPGVHPWTDDRSSVLSVIRWW
jgi:spermidine synthase